MSGACDGFENILDARFTDAGNDILCNPISPAITGDVKPLQELLEFNGENALGIWKLRVVDSADDDLGKLNDWSLEICSLEAVLAVNNYVFDNFKIFPNPSDGRFRIQFNSENTADVEISVYDLLGRKIANRVFKNSFTAFDEEID